MKKQIELIVQPEKANNQDFLKLVTAKKLHLRVEEITALIVVRRSIDARANQPKYRILADVYINEKPPELYPKINYKPVASKKKVIIIGFGPAGIFAALRLIESGIKPVVFDRGKDVQSRRKDLRNIQQFGIVNPDSNYCFGEGGAGTYSDGKLYTRSTKRGDVSKILSLFVQHGAQQEILIDAHPHIGSNVLPKVVKSFRDTINVNNGEVHFESRLTDLLLDNGKVKGVIINDSEEHIADAVILGTGHSARDIYELLLRKNIKLEPKSFAMGVRIEHPQALINEIQYHTPDKGSNLPAASYNLSCQVDDRGVYSFCMCPGGIIIPASTSPGELVLNGMSISKRDSLFANAGFVVSITEHDCQKYEQHGIFAGLEYQKELEHKAFTSGGKTQAAPAQRITDFVNGRISADLPDTSYIPGLVSAPLHQILPANISIRLREALKIFGKKMKGYYTEEAQILAAETRTSSPLRIPRDRETFMHEEVEGLFPCGEGAGYAGGIVSAAIDGENCAAAAVKYLNR